MNRYTKTILIVSGLLSAGALLPWALNQHLTLRQYNIQTKKLRRPVRLILLADLHSCCYGPQQQALLQMIYDRHPDAVLFAGDIMATGFWAARIAEIGPEDTVLILGAGPTGICTLLCVLLKEPKQVIVCEKDPARLQFVREHYPQVLTVGPEEVLAFTQAHSGHGGADRVLEVAGAEETFRLAWQCARPNAVVTVVALYDGPQILPLPEMYGKNLTFKTGGVDGCDGREILDLIAAGKLDTTPLITHTVPLRDIAAAYDLFEHRRDGVIKVAVDCSMA